MAENYFKCSRCAENSGIAQPDFDSGRLGPVKLSVN